MDVLECKVCFENYESEGRKPRSLGCGHTYCSICLEDMLNKGIDTCPGCRKPYSSTIVADFPVNYSILELLEVVEQSKSEITAASLSENIVKPPQTSAGVCEEHGNHLLFYCAICTQWICRDCTIIDHQDGKGHSVLTIKAALAQKKNEAIRHFDATESLREKHSMGLKDYLEQVKTGTDMLERLSEQLTKSLRFSLEEQDRIKQIMAEGEHLQLEISVARGRCTEIHTYEEVNAAMLRTTTCQDAYAKWTTNTSSSLMALENRNSFLKWLMWMTCINESRNGKTNNPVVYAAQEVKGGSRFAAITSQHGLLHLHSLSDIPPPEDAVVLNYNRVHELVNVSGALTFLKLSWSDSQGGYVYIRLGEEYSRRNHNFLLLCTGEQESTYCGTNFHNIHWIGRCGEFVVCGDYEKKNGTGGAPLLEGLEYDGTLKQLIECGTVAGLNRRNTTASMFKIYTKDSPGYFDKAVFGRVETGMDVMRQAVTQKTIQSIVVEDCGVIISL